MADQMTSSSSAQSARQPNLPPLTSLRWFAAVGVLTLHAGKFFGFGNIMKTWGIPSVMTWFFILSGFILFYTHPVLPNPTERKKFYLMRFARVYPLFFVTFLASILLIPNSALFEAATEQWQIWVAIPLHLTLTQSWPSKPGFDLIFNSVSWSISCECFFYFCFPFILKNFRRDWKLWLFGTYAVTIAFGLAVDAFHLSWTNDDAMGTTALGVFHGSPFVRLNEFVTGMALGYALECRRARQQSLFENKLSINTATLLESISIAFLIFSMGKIDGISDWLFAHNARGLAAWIFQSGSLPASVLVVSIFALNRGYISRVLSFRFFVVLGEVSYSFYLWHNIWLLHWREGAGWPFAHSLPAQYRFFVFTGMITLGSYVSYRLIERPGKELVMKIAGHYRWAGVKPRKVERISK